MASTQPPPISYDIATLTVEDFFGYTPSIVLASVALGLFVLAAMLVAGQTMKFKHARYMHIVSVTGLLEAAGYAVLIWITTKSGEANIYGGYVCMQVLIVLSPNLLQATDYWTLSKVLEGSGLSAERRAFRPSFIRWSFIVADLVALVVQAIGISLWASSQGSGTPDQDTITTGSIITLAGLTFQLGCFLVFLLVTIHVQRHPRNSLRNEKGHTQLFVGLYLTIAFISLRNFYRLAEFAQNTVLEWPPAEGTYILSEQQVLFFTLDTLPILLCFLSFILFHPSRLLPRGPPKAVEAVGAGP